MKANEFVDLIEDQSKHSSLGSKSDEELGLIVQAAAALIQKARYYVALRNLHTPVPQAPKSQTEERPTKDGEESSS